MFDSVRRWWWGSSPEVTEEALREQRAALLAKAPIPTLWLFGKTGSGKSSIIRYLTGAEAAEIGNGFRPQTTTSRRFDFPSSEEPLVTFLDTRGLGEVGYEPAEDIAAFATTAQLVIVTVRVTDHAVDDILVPLKELRAKTPDRPVLLALTCLHLALPATEDVSAADPFEAEGTTVPATLPEPLKRAIQSQLERFQGLFDAVVPLDLTEPFEGFADPEFGGRRLKQAILKLLPAAYRHTLASLEEVVVPLKDILTRQARSTILSSSTLAATAAAVPLPWLDIPVVFAIQRRLAQQLAALYGQEMTNTHWTSLNAIAGGRLGIQLALRALLKALPWVGAAANAASAFAYTYALGMAWQWYLQEVCQGHLPQTAELQKIFQDQLQRGAALWKE